jgi:pimeloyl-ACP methyl ester carboxylesterase
MGYEEVLLYDPQGCARGITVPSVFVQGTNDLLCPPEPARHFFERMLTEKAFHQIDTRSHIDLYDDDHCVAEAVGRTAGFLRQWLGLREGVRS